MAQQRRLEQPDAHRVCRCRAKRTVVAEALCRKQLHYGCRASCAARRKKQRRVGLGAALRTAGTRQGRQRGRRQH